MKIIRTKVFKTLVALFIVGLLLGIISYFFYDKSDNYIINYFNLLKNDSFNYINCLFESLFNNYKYAFFIWIFGFIPILSFIIPFIIIFRGISLGFSIISIISSFKLKGLILSLILLLTECINNMIYILLSYYGLNISYKIFNIIRSNRSINIKSFFKNYIYQLLIFLSVLLISSLFETYISSNIYKFVL